MLAETLLVVGALALATLPLLLPRARGGQGRPSRAAVVAWGVALAVMAWTVHAYAPTNVEIRTRDVRPLEAPTDGYVTSKACKACHPGEHATWHATYHRTMTTAATPETVKAPFDGLVLSGGDHSIEFSQRGDEYWVRMPDPEYKGDGKAPIVDRQIVQVTGSHHTQVFWTASGEARRLNIFPVVYRIPEGQWLSLDANFLTPPQLGQEKATGRWHSNCNRCHVTHARPRIRSFGEMDTHVSELGIACEACHGPGAEHVAANRDPWRRWQLHASGEPDPTIVNPARLPHDRASEVCAQCHGHSDFRTAEDREHWTEHGFRFRPGEELFTDRQLASESDHRFWPDGMIRVSGREFNGLARTPCYTHGDMSCLSCHVMHQEQDDPRPTEEWTDDMLGVGMRGNAACTQCHPEYEDPTTLVEHTHHAADSPGSNCYNCHMPYTSYGLLKAIRSHGLDSPSVASTLETGRPNACNQCHLDKTLAWTADRLSEWHGQQRPALGPDESTVAASILWTLKGDAGLRGLMAWSFGWDAAQQASGHEWTIPFLALLMNDEYHAVRSIAYRSLLTHPEREGVPFEFIGPGDPRYAQVMQDWKRDADSPKRRREPELLVGSRGLLDADRFEALLAQRDLRPVTLAE